MTLFVEWTIYIQSKTSILNFIDADFDQFRP